ncbi:MAG: glycoside hydrolase family 172 protein [Bryobacteraceae bacterium]
MKSVFLLAVLAPAVCGQNIDQPQNYTAARVSSAAADGSNADAVLVAPRASHIVAEIPGAGRIVHVWFTIATDEEKYLSTTRLKMFWDGAAQPAVDVPFGEFFLLGHNRVRQVNTAFVTVEARPELNHNLPNKNVGGFNSYFPMPYARGARIVIENGSEKPLRALYYQVDYQKWQAAPSPLRFHAAHNHSAPEPFTGPAAGARTAKNPEGKGNHVLLDVNGRGHLAGVSISVDGAGAGWWEGDEMVWVDGEPRPSIAGTGTEDYFGGAWGFRREYNTPYHGVTFLEKVPGRPDWQAGLYTFYRFHERDPIPFSRSLRMTIERGHNNHRRDSAYSSVAYYYLAPSSTVRARSGHEK